MEARLLAAQARAGQPAALFEEFGDLCREQFGFKLYTLLRWDPSRDAIQRIHSSDHQHYPVGAWKPMGPTPWGERLLKGGSAVLCRDEADLRWAFPDADLLKRLDCIANLASPIRFDGKVLGVASISDSSGAYDQDDLETFDRLAQALALGLVACTSASTETLSRGLSAPIS